MLGTIRADSLLNTCPISVPFVLILGLVLLDKVGLSPGMPLYARS
jgi:hypothetical protein